MTITLTTLAIIASLSSSVSTPDAVTDIVPTQTQVLSKDELVQIINDEQKTNINFEEIQLTVPSLTINNIVSSAKTFIASNKKKTITATDKALGDDE